jgi:curved DNA-binding protein CbpA
MARGESTVDDEAYPATLTLVSGVDVRELPIGPTEAFVLSRIDGLSSLSDIAGATGLTPEEARSIVDRLVTLGAAEFRSRVAPVAPSTQRSGAHSIPLGLQNQSQGTSELSFAQQERILDLDQRRSSLDHYELLGVSSAADTRAIRAAYYELVHVYHPDRYFGKQLGSYAGPLLRVFGAFTEAYEVLRRDESRAEYDRYLCARTRTRDFDSYFQDSSHQPPGESSSREPPGESSSREPPGESSSHEPSSESSPPTLNSRASLVSSGSASLRRPSQAPTNDTESRRRALARKLGHSSAPPPTVVSTVPPKPVSTTPPGSGQHAADELRRRYEQRLAQARDEQRTHYLTLAKESESRNDLIAAANALRLACSLEPGNLELMGDLAELERRAAAALWESYLERAKYAAVEGNLVEAAESYERAALGQPNASLFERAAFYTLESGGDLKRASKLAKQAVAIAPNSAKCRLTLAQIYAAADLRDSALSELERARALEPNQPVIKDWIARVKRGKP